MARGGAEATRNPKAAELELPWPASATCAVHLPSSFGVWPGRSSCPFSSLLTVLHSLLALLLPPLALSLHLTLVLTFALSMQAEVDQDSGRDVQRTGNKKSSGMHPGMEMGPTFPKPREILSAQASFLRPLQEQPEPSRGQVGGLPPRVPRGNPGGPGDSHALPREQLLLRPCLPRGCRPGSQRWAVGTHAAHACPLLPACCCLTTWLSSLLRPAARHSGARQRP